MVGSEGEQASMTAFKLNSRWAVGARLVGAGGAGRGGAGMTLRLCKKRCGARRLRPGFCQAEMRRAMGGWGQEKVSIRGTFFCRNHSFDFSCVRVKGEA